MYVRKIIHFLLFLIGGKKMPFLIRPPPDRAEKSGQQISLHPDAVDAEKKKYA